MNSIYTEHEKLAAIRAESQTCGEFLDWLIQHKGYILAKWKNSWELGAVHYSIQELLAEFFNIDLSKIDKEKEQMLEEARKSYECHKAVSQTQEDGNPS